jgi:hypothetical protein
MKIGNILPHIVSLLFRSLTSRPEPAVDAAHAALRDILSLSAKSKDSDPPHRLPKNLLQMCIRPVLLNLREYTKLSIPLLRGLSRLLSLLSSWFSKTLGEKLLEHLQRWTDPEKIIRLAIWKRGEEPLVAAAIIELFELLPDDSSHFVELLVKTTLKLENALPRYKTRLMESPFRLPLTKYLNKHEEATAAFFVNDHRLKNPIYSDLLQDIIKRSESNALRKKLSDKTWSTTLLNVCFERPLAIIRAEKGSSSTNPSSRSHSPRNAADILSMHGINIDLTGQGQKLAASRQDLESKKEKLQSATKEEIKVKDKLEKLRRSESSATPEKSEKIKRSINNAQRQLDKAKNAFMASRKEVEAAQKEYNIELAKTKRESERSDGRQTPRSMTFDALELQHQGFCLVETLIKNDTSYISEHTDVVRAFRWLWRSKGRHFRLFHEDSMPPRFNGESRVLARFLINFAKTNNDVDILFDLLRIFLQPTSSDFSFVQKFLKDTVCNSLSIGQKKRVMQRFFPVIASDGIEELKVLSIQLLILPMLKNDFESSLESNAMDVQKEKLNSNTKQTNGLENEAKSDSINSNNAKENDTIQGANETMTTSITEDATTNANSNKNDTSSKNRVLDSELTSTFIAEVLLQGGKSRTYGSRLSIELLKLSSLLLEFMGNKMAQHRQDLIKFTWSLLKSEDVKTKQWACISVCHYISVFPTPSKNILQIYAILLRSHHQEAKHLASMAIDLLIPSLPERLSLDDYAKIVQYTMKILYEEGNSLPSLSHIWRTVVRHEATFYNHRHKIVPHLVTSLNKLGLPMNSSLENRNLSISMVELLLRWDSYSSQRFTDFNSKYLADKDRLEAEGNMFTGLASPECSPMKKIKRLPKLQTKDVPHTTTLATMNNSELETIVNFLVRLILLIAASDKKEQGKVAEDAHFLLQRMLNKWQDIKIRIAYFDKVESMCIEEQRDAVKSSKQSLTTTLDSQKNKKGNRSTDKLPATVRKCEGSKSIPDSLLSACVRVFSNILQFAPQNPFLCSSEEKICHILLTCFNHSGEENQNSLRDKLSNFLLLLFKVHETNTFLQEACKSFLETSLLGALESSSKNGENLTENKISQTDVRDHNTYDAVLFFLQTIEEISAIRSNFPELLVGTLIIAADKLSKTVITASSRKRSTVNSITPTVSPFVAVFDEACSARNIKGKKGLKGHKKSKDVDSKSIETSLEINSLICCLRLIGKCNVPCHFTRLRETFINILNDILDFSSNIKLLLAVTVQVGNWLSNEENTGPLTSNEKECFVTKLIALEDRGLPEIESQPLFHAVSLIILNMHKKQNFTKRDNAPFLNRSLVGCLLVTNQRLHELIINSFVSTLCDDVALDSIVVELDYGLGNQLNLATKETQTSNHRPMDVVEKLFRSAFDALGGRLWTFVFVDILLAISNNSGGIKLTPVKPNGQLPTRSSNNGINGNSKNDGTSNVGITSLSIPPLDNSKLDHYDKFIKIITNERSDSSNSRGLCIHAVRTLASCDIELSQGLLEALLQKAWLCSNNKERLGIIPSIELFLTRPTHVQFLKKPIPTVTSIYPVTKNIRHRDINSIQMMLRAIGNMTPIPVFSIDAMLFWAKNYNCWHEVRR